MLRIVWKQNFDFKLVPEIVFGLFPLDKWLIHSGWWNNILVLIYEDILGMSPGNNFSIIRIYKLSFQKHFDWTKWFLEFFLFAKYYPENCCDFLIIIKNSWWMMTVSLLKAFSIFAWLEKMNFNTLSISLELISIAWYFPLYHYFYKDTYSFVGRIDQWLLMPSQTKKSMPRILFSASNRKRVSTLTDNFPGHIVHSWR